jgi:nicotinamide-nucleotide adenylyltransferase
LIGRFQPFHKGHLAVIKKILTEVDELLIIVGSSQYAGTVENPFSADERTEMINRALKEEGISGFQVYKVPDINNDDLYPAHVLSHVPQFEILYSGNSLVQRLFREAGKEVHKIKPIRGEVYSGTYIRRRMVESRRWKHLVPKSVSEYINEIKGVERVKELFHLRSA